MLLQSERELKIPLEWDTILLQINLVDYCHLFPFDLKLATVIFKPTS